PAQDGLQRRAQLVREGRNELVLQPIGGLGGLPRHLDLVPRAHLVGHVPGRDEGGVDCAVGATPGMRVGDDVAVRPPPRGGGGSPPPPPAARPGSAGADGSGDAGNGTPSRSARPCPRARSPAVMLELMPVTRVPMALTKITSPRLFTTRMASLTMFSAASSTA